MQEFADLLAVSIANAAARQPDHEADAEAKQIRARWEELKTATEGFVEGCEEGTFSAMKKENGSKAKGLTTS